MSYDGCGNIAFEEYDIIISDKEKALIIRLRKIPYGRVTVFMKDGQILRIEKVTESIAI